MSTAFRLPELPDIEYPDDDGNPMAENTLQFTWIVVIKEGLEVLFKDNPDVFVAGDLLWYPVQGNNKIRTAPDAMVAFGRPKGRRGSYKQWEEGGVAPQVVFEVLSPGNKAREMARKLAFYERYGVEEYYIYDPDTGRLVGRRRVRSSLITIKNMSGFVSPRLNIRFEPGPGADNLKIYYPDGRLFLTYTELFVQQETDRQIATRERKRAAEQRKRAAEQRKRAAEERRRAAIETKRADDAIARADRLAAKLRELGVEPD